MLLKYVAVEAINLNAVAYAMHLRIGDFKTISYQRHALLMLKFGTSLYEEMYSNTLFTRRWNQQGCKYRKDSCRHMLNLVSLRCGRDLGEDLLSSNLVTLGQNFFSRNQDSGYAACSRVYGRSHLSVNRSC